MHNQSIYLDAIETVLAWNLPEELFADAVNAQASLMAGIDPEGIGGLMAGNKDCHEKIKSEFI